MLAVITYPLHKMISGRASRPWLAADLTVLIATIGLALPAVWVVRQIAQEALDRAETARSLLDGEQWKSVLDRFPRLSPLRSWIESQIDIRAEFARASKDTAKGMRSFLARSFEFAISIFVMLFLLFYFLRDWRSVLQAVRSLVPLAPQEADQVLDNVRRTIHAIVYGTLAVGVVQGALGGLMFWWLGLPAPLLWGTVRALLALLPVFGAAIIWLPAAIYLAVQGDWHKALLLMGWGAIVISLIDNMLYPVFVKDKLRLHTVPVFIVVLGGLAVFGATGIVLGPLVLAVGMALLDIWRRRMALGEVVSSKTLT